MALHERIQSLSYAVRHRVVARYLGQLLAAVGVVTMPPFAVALLNGEYPAALRLLLVMALLIPGGLALARLPEPRQLQGNEALVISALAFVLTPLVMAFAVTGYGIPFVDALFETVSAVTTTGLTTVIGVHSRESSFLFTRAWMQWYGGLGIVVLSLALLAEPGGAARSLARAGSEREDLVAGTRLHARRVLSVYLAFTLAGTLALWLTGLDAYRALLHALAGISTGGFSTYDENMAGFAHGSSQAVLMALSLCGAVSLALYHPAYYRNWRELSGHLELRGLLGATLASILLLALCMGAVGGHDWAAVLHHAPLMAVSAQTGAGFSSLEAASLDSGSKLTLIVSMFIGGGVGSTAGGIKILRLLILLQLLRLMVQRAAMPPHAVVQPSLGDYRLKGAEIEHALLIILSFLLVILLSWFAFLAYGYPPLDALFDVVSATGTVGLSSGVTDATLPLALKAVLCLDMLLGRLEIVALLLLLYPPTWIGRRLD
jgi:trk system potassium uptake protein TrkH